MYGNLLIIMKTVTNKELLSSILSIKVKVDRHEVLLNQLMQRVFKLEEVVNERTALLPKLYDNVDKMMGEIKENRQERTFMNSRLVNHEDRIVKLEHAAA